MTDPTLFENADHRRAVVTATRLATFSIDSPQRLRSSEPVEVVPVDGVAPEPGWIETRDALPACRNGQLYLGVNAAGFAGVFNAVADMAGDVKCMYETAEECIDVLSGLALWRPFNPPSTSCGIKRYPEQSDPGIRLTRAKLTTKRADAPGVLIDEHRQAPLHADAAKMPVLPDWLLNAIGEYGMARTDRVGEPEILHRWQELIRGIKRYAADCVSVTNLQQSNEAKK